MDGRGLVSVVAVLALTTAGAGMSPEAGSPAVADRPFADDGLALPVERAVGTDPADPDTDDDGIPDCAELALEGADPLHRDVFVEIDRTEGAGEWLSPEVRSRLVDAFATAPISNPDGRPGVRLHLIEDDVVGASVEGFDADTYDVFGRVHRDDGPAFFYAVLAGDLHGERLRGEAYPGNRGFVVDANRTSSPAYYDVGSVFMHELGHVLGLRDGAFVGIDSRAYYFREYPSVMNYDAPPGIYDFSRGPPFDGWRYLERHGFPAAGSSTGTAISDGHTASRSVADRPFAGAPGGPSLRYRGDPVRPSAAGGIGGGVDPGIGDRAAPAFGDVLAGTGCVSPDGGYGPSAVD